MGNNLSEQEIAKIIEVSEKVTEEQKSVYLFLAFEVECKRCNYSQTCDIKNKEPCWKVTLTRDYLIWQDWKKDKTSKNGGVV